MVVNSLDLDLNLIKWPKFLLRPVDQETVEFHELVDSIKDHGLLQPILVRPVNHPAYKYEVVIGNHRYHACKYLNLPSVPCTIRNLTDDEVLEWQIQENAIRIEATPIEYAVQIEKIMSRHPDLTVARVSKLLKKSPHWVSSVLRLTSLKKVLAERARRGEMRLQVAYELARVPAKLQEEVYDEVKFMTVREAIPVIRSIIKDYRENVHRYKLGIRANKGLIPQPFLQSMGDIKDEYKTLIRGPEVLIKMKANTPLEAWQACLAWLLHLDPDSIKKQEDAFKRRVEKKALLEVQRKKDREELRRLRETYENLNNEESA